MMNVGAIACGVFFAVFLLLGIVFAALGERGVHLISGFGALEPDERALYDTDRMWRGQRNSIFVWAAVFAVGGILSLLVSQYCAIAAFAVWLILFFREVHFDVEKAFEKYRRK